MAVIKVQIDPESAEFYEQISEEERSRISELVTQALRRARAAQVMAVVRQTSELAKARGMTPELLEELLRDDDLGH